MLTYSANEAPENTPFLDSVQEAKDAYVALQVTLGEDQKKLHTQTQLVKMLAELTANSKLISEQSVLQMWCEEGVSRVHHHSILPSQGIYLLNDCVIIVEADVNASPRYYALHTHSHHFKASKMVEQEKHGVNVSDDSGLHFRVIFDDAKLADVWYEALHALK